MVKFFVTKALERVTIEKGGFVRLPPTVLTRLKVDVGDYINVEETGFRCLLRTKADTPEQDADVAPR